MICSSHFIIFHLSMHTIFSDVNSVMIQTSNQVVLIGGSFRITCVVLGNISPSPEDILWKKDGEVLFKGAIFSRSNVTIGENGYYECHVRGVTNGTDITVRGKQFSYEV